MKTNILFIFCLIFLFGCSRQFTPLESSSIRESKKIVTDLELKNWESLDLNKDSIPGLSLDKAFNELIKSKNGNELIVAVLDTEIDISHEAIKDILWVNKNEIPNNGFDDDKNGYIDDVNGWNFLGYEKNQSLIRNSYECTRIINYFNKNKIETKHDSLQLEKAKKIQEGVDKEFLNEKGRIDFYKSVFPNCFKTIKLFFPNGKYTLKQIDSLYSKFKDNKERIGDEIYFLNELKKYNLDSTWVSNNIKDFDLDAKTVYNKDYFEKDLTKDNPYDLKDSIYGNNNLSLNAKKAWHSTQVSGLISKLVLNKNRNIKIMPIVMVTPKGEENDKDVAIAIRYAVNNGAKIINMSFAKEVSLNSKWITEALVFASKKDVLVISAAGNSGLNIDEIPIYPLDYDTNSKKEFCENFIKVGGISPNILKGVSYENSNYSKINVDIFAPATDLYVPDATKGYTFNRGTSLASSLVSGAAAVIRSYYPKLKASEVKQIILNSGISFDSLQVQVPGEKKGTLKPFKDLSKSGKVVNIYNALLFAKDWHKKKRN